MKSLRRNKKGVSDVIAVLLMIAIAVAASLIAYAWVMGYLGGVTGKVGNVIQIQSMYTDGTNLYVYVQNVGTAPVTLSSVYVNGALAAGATFTYPAPGTAPLAINQTATVTITPLPPGFSTTTAVDVKVVCTDGTFISADQIVPST